MGRNSDNKLIKEMINWAPDENLEAGLVKTYSWISEQIKLNKKDAVC
jgi:dTDP-D-glucose 4,6-dehydratase